MRILIVEDELTIASMIENMLLSLGHDVVDVAMRLPDALNLANDIALDLAFLDVNLEGLLSFPVAEILTRRGIPFVFLTGYGPDGIIDPYKQRPLLKKPFRLADLERSLLYVRWSL